ncbi:hypothetical protein CLPU_3c01730 [Gottschalkia purinilytica]|uniref:Uncharacterized protein n=1 Tax=Gottschalkia purinilytica TaxID=1503 RepID=A0A0L0WD89_GOTPU|nr:hypothetical protein [Gottschalkia purinilytica]KNF09395.1 hypothetical protein CLPU_3c01730 [Gottschalkia purinilytica]
MDGGNYEKYHLVYTSYSKKHRGKIKLPSNNNKSRIIIKDNNLFGTFDISRKNINGIDNNYIIYFTNEENKIKVTICDINGNNIKDITDMIIN